MSSPLFLFDVDGTLVINSGSTHLQATVNAISDVFDLQLELAVSGQSHFINDKKVDGLTMPHIFHLVLSPEGISESEVIAALPALADRSAVQYRALLESGASAGDPPLGTVATLDALRAAGAKMGLLTGGTRGLVHEKLSSLGLGEYFSFGAFGDRAFERSGLFPEAMLDFEKVHGESSRSRRVIYIGDTRHDVAAGHAAGAIVYAVASGAESADALIAAEADRVFESLAHAKETLLGELIQPASR